MNQEEFSKALGEALGRSVAPSQISDWERGRREPGAAVILAAADLAGGSVDSLRSGGVSTMAERLAQVEEQLEEARARLTALEEADRRPPASVEAVTHTWTETLERQAAAQQRELRDDETPERGDGQQAAGD